jgi:acyl-CoA synthetase (AMP-forming)/AMP-acid ligase II
MKPAPIEALVNQAQARPRATAFVFHEEAWTYERIAAESGRLARGMAARGVKPGDRVVLHMMNRPEYIVAYYACFRLGAIAAPLRTAFKFAELEPLLQRLKPALYIGETTLYENVASLDAAVLPRDRRFVVDASSPGDDGIPWEKLFERGGTEAPTFPGADKPAVLVTTSGTTGEPKFVVHTAATLSESVDLLIDGCGWFRDDVMAMPLPLAHMSGLITLLTLVRAGARFVLIESFDAETVLDAIERHRCTVHLGFPAQYVAMLTSQGDRPRNLATLRYCLSGADSCPIDLQMRVTSSFGAPLHNFWAASESVGNLSFGRRPGPLMQIVDSAQVRLIDEKGNEVAEGETGELLVRGPNLFAGYWEDPHATAESIRDGWYHTGDLVRRQGDELMYVSRKKDIIIRGGTNISPVEVEQAIVAAHPAVEEAAVVGVPDAALGQRVFGFVKLAKGQRPAVVLDILDNLSTRLAGYKVPEQLFVLDALPRNALSKVDRKTLQGMASRGLTPDAQADAPLPERKRVAGKRPNRVVPAR